MGKSANYSGTVKYRGLEVTLEVVEGVGTIKTNFHRVDIPCSPKKQVADGERMCYCDNCSWSGTEKQLGKTLFDMNKLWDRLEEGGETPAGECPKCLACAYLDEARDLQTAQNEAYAYNGALDALESLILAHACAGVDVSALVYMYGVADALDAVDNKLG